MAKPKRKKDKGKPRRGVGRPPLEFTPEQVSLIEELAFDGCQTRTIATIMGIDKDTLARHFGPLMTKRRCERKAYLRKLQTSSAAGGDHTMQIWLGKQELGQSDKQEIEQTHKLKLFDKDAPTDEV